METIILDSNGYPRLDRFNFVKNELEISLGELQEKYEDDFQQQIINKSKRPVRKEISTVQVKTMLYKACIGIGMVDNAVAQSLTKEQLKSVYIEFLDLIDWLQDYCVFAPSKQIFCSFIGIADNNYNWLMQYGSQEQKEIMQMIDNYIVDLSLEQAQQGRAKETTTKFRMKARQIGHAIVEASAVDGLIDKAEQQYDQQYFNNILANIVPKQIGGDNK